MASVLVMAKKARMRNIMEQVFLKRFQPVRMLERKKASKRAVPMLQVRTG